MKIKFLAHFLSLYIYVYVSVSFFLSLSLSLSYSTALSISRTHSSHWNKETPGNERSLVAWLKKEDVHMLPNHSDRNRWLSTVPHKQLWYLNFLAVAVVTRSSRKLWTLPHRRLLHLNEEDYTTSGNADTFLAARGKLSICFCWLSSHVKSAMCEEFNLHSYLILVVVTTY